MQGLAAVKSEYNWGFIDYDGIRIGQTKIFRCQKFLMSNGLSIVRNNEAYGLINKIGQEIVKPLI